ncbi:hypothetical protein N9E35_01655 [Candidatus Marinimicrobia bacterium]|nr:hypothetical protein [Candidatus Neomarinimicrobiota bacterium]
MQSAAGSEPLMKMQHARGECVCKGCNQPGKKELGMMCLECYETHLFDGEVENWDYPSHFLKQ